MGNSSLVAADIFHDRNDVWTPLPFLRTMEKNLGFRYPGVTADSGYGSEEAYTYLREQKQKPYIKHRLMRNGKSAVSNRILFCPLRRRFHLKHNLLRRES